MKTQTNNDKNYYRLKDNIDWVGDKKYNRIVYRTWWMIAVNLLLKILQAFTKWRQQWSYFRVNKYFTIKIKFFIKNLLTT